MQDRNAIRQTLLELIEADTGQTYGSLDDQANLKEQLGLDSVDVVSIVMQVENRFRIRLGHEELQQVVTVGNLLDLMQAKLAELPDAAAA
ncbi:hypothetical protein AYO44_04840 [Planctomycetaceae bacterium SCGC AG-212-F19]|nr:hypothetical protein AYO44_04840 [Planctomycetaceae bacterium SCGC AG-212-F19]